MSLFQGGGRGQAGCQNVFIFFVLIMGGREGVKANKSNVFKYSLFLEGFPKLFIVGFTWYLIQVYTKVIAHTLYFQGENTQLDIILQLYPGAASLVEDLEITHQNIYRYGHQFIILSLKRSWYTFITMLERSCYCQNSKLINIHRRNSINIKG